MLGSTSYSTTNDLTGRLIFTSNTTLKFFFDTYIRTFAIGGGGGGGSEGSPSSNAWSWAGGGYSGEITCATDILFPKILRYLSLLVLAEIQVLPVLDIKQDHLQSALMVL